MFVVRLFRFFLIFIIFLVLYLPITLNPKIFERKLASAVSDIVEGYSASANIIDYQSKEV